MNPEQALTRLEQLAKEHLAALNRRDIGLVLRICKLYQPTLFFLRSAPLADNPENRKRMMAVQHMLDECEVRSQIELGRITQKLKKSALGRRQRSAYKAVAAPQSFMDASY